MIAANRVHFTFKPRWEVFFQKSVFAHCKMATIGLADGTWVKTNVAINISNPSQTLAFFAVCIILEKQSAINYQKCRVVWLLAWHIYFAELVVSPKCYCHTNGNATKKSVCQTVRPFCFTASIISFFFHCRCVCSFRSIDEGCVSTRIELCVKTGSTWY